MAWVLMSLGPFNISEERYAVAHVREVLSKIGPDDIKQAMRELREVESVEDWSQWPLVSALLGVIPEFSEVHVA